jgi:hypothetical protein
MREGEEKARARWKSESPRGAREWRDLGIEMSNERSAAQRQHQTNKVMFAPQCVQEVGDTHSEESEERRGSARSHATRQH